MTALEDAYALLGLEIDASFAEVASRYAQIVRDSCRPDGRPRTNMPAIHHSFKCILNRYPSQFSYEDECDDDDYDDCPEYFYEYYEDELRDLREAKFTRPRQRSDVGYQVNTDGATVAANAQKLLEEEATEEKISKAEKKKKKKKKKRKRATENTPPEVNVNNNNSNDVQDENESDSDSDGEGLDLNSAFAKAARKTASDRAKAVATNGNRTETRRVVGRNITAQTGGGGGGDAEPPDAVRVSARRMAVSGNELAKRGDYDQAVQVFTHAIRLDPNDHRFFGNRSFCFERLRLYDKALRDAERAITIDPSWPKGYFRKGRALLGQRNYKEAEEAFLEVDKLDKKCVECHRELEKIAAYRLMSMGFARDRARAAIRQFKTQEAALEALLRGDVRDEPDDSSDSDSDTGEPSPGGNLDPKEDPSNVEGLSSLWVGNVMPTATERELHLLFAKHGAVIGVRVLPDRFCAFVNFSDKRGASLAMQHLQGHEFHGKFLKIKFPDNPIDRNGQQNVVLGRKGPQVMPAAAAASAAAAPAKKLTGPVGDGECFFWRAMECYYGANCKYKHIPANKGIDKKSGKR